MSALTTTKATIFGSVRIIHTTGLHARPSLMFTRLAKTFTANIG
ncbi:MAG: HPr family phosphocarrier protein, partial [Notoacmeibacter sp.]